MFFMDLLGWWYGAGFKDLSAKFSALFASTADFFSIGDLAKSLFQPFRQTLTTSNYKQTLGQRIGDAFISRAVGFFTRFFLIIFGAAALLFEVVMMGLIFVTWPIVPILPLVFIGLSLTNFGF
jgi:hypothetical protein